MIIDRHKEQGNVAKERVAFCLDQLEKAGHFEHGLQWDSEIVTRLTIEEMIGALVAAEQALQE